MISTGIPLVVIYVDPSEQAKQPLAATPSGRPRSAVTHYVRGRILWISSNLSSQIFPE